MISTTIWVGVHGIALLAYSFIVTGHCEYSHNLLITIPDLVESQLRSGTNYAFLAALLQWASLVVPGGLPIATAVLLGVQVPALGWLGCMPGDTHCCPSSDCPTEPMSYNMTGCDGPVIIAWDNPTNFCPLPEWYVVDQNQCGSLSDIPDYRFCAEFGCSNPTAWWCHVVWAVSVLGVVGASLFKKQAVRPG